MCDKYDDINTKENIIDVAGRLMTEKGVKNTSLADIARETGISKGTLYYYYSSKDDIIYDITEKHLKHITQELLHLIENIGHEASPKDILQLVFEKILQEETRGKLHLYLINDAVSGNINLQRKIREKYKEWTIMIEDGLKKVLKNRNIDYTVVSHIIVAGLDGFTIQWILGVEKIPIEDIATLLAEVE